MNEPKECVFCAVVGGSRDRGVSLPVSPGFVVFPALAQRPRNRGHMLLVPVTHVTALEALPPGPSRSLGHALAGVSAAVREAFSAPGVTARLNLGPPAQGIAHIHVHVVPRHIGDDFTTSTSVPVPLAERLGQTAALAPILHRHLTEPRGSRFPG